MKTLIDLRKKTTYDMDMDHEASDGTPEFSVITFFKLFQKEFERAKLDKNLLNIQADAYSRIPRSEDEDEVFATYESGRKASDTTLRFALELTSIAFALHIEGGPLIYGGMYELIFEDEKSAALSLVDTLLLLHSGQIKSLVTLRNGEFCASELLLKTSASSYTVLSTEADYRWWWPLENDEHAYNTVLLSNNDIPPLQKLPKNIFLAEYDEEGVIQNRGRLLTTISPLTKADYQYILHEFQQRDIGNEGGENEWSYLYKQWEFWLCSIIIIVVSFWLTDAFHLWDVLVAPLVAGGIYLISTTLLAWKHRVALTHPEHRWIRFGEFIRRNIVSGALVLLGLTMFSLQFTPIYTPLGSSNATTLQPFLSSTPWLYSALLALGVACVLGLSRAMVRRIWSFVMLFIGTAVLVFFNFAYTNSDADTPEPYMTLVGLLSLGILCTGIGLVIWLLSDAFRHRKRREKPLTQVGDTWFSLLLTLSSIALIAGALRMRDEVNQSMLMVGTPQLLWIIVSTTGVVGILYSLGLLAKRPLPFSDIVYTLLFFIVVGALGFATTDKINDLPDITWVLVFGGALSMLFLAGIRAWLRANRQGAILRERNFSNPDDQSSLH